MILALKKKYRLTLLFGLIPLLFLGQVKNIGLPEIRNYKRSDYKGGTQNWNIDQDSNDNIYFANNDGLFQFDGTVWTKYELPNKSVVRSLKTSKSGKIYVGGYNEFGFFKPNEKGQLIYFSLSKFLNKKEINSIDIIWKIHLLNNEVIFQCFDKAYIYKNNSIKIIKPPTRFQFSFLAENKLYFQDITKGLLEYKKGKLIPLVNTDFLNATEVWGVFNLSQKKLLITTLDKGIFIYENNKLSPWNTDANSFIKKNSGLGGVKMKNNYIVLNSVLNGMIVCNQSGKIVQHINRKKGLQNNTVLTSYIDKKNNLWLGLDNGITFINENSPFTFFGFSYNLSTVYATAIHKGYIYVATNQGVFYHSWSFPFKEDNFELIEGTTGQAWNIQVIDDQLLCSHNRGALVIDRNKLKKSLDNVGYWSFKKAPSNPDFMIGSNYKGFSLLKKENREWKFVQHIEGFSKSVGEFEIDNKNIWVKKDELIYQMNLSSDLKKFNFIKTFEKLSKTDNGITSIQRIQNTIYFQKDSQFYTYSEKKKTFEKEDKITNIFKKIPKTNTIHEDQYGNIWYVIKESLGVLLKNNDGSYTNTIAPFLNLTQDLVYNNLSINTVDPKNIFIGLTDGLVHYDSKLYNDFGIKPRVYIRNFSSTVGSIISGNGQTSSLITTIPYQSNYVKFRFSTPTYENIENIKYSYKLDGFDENWSNWSPSTTKEYTNLREGNYKMKVRVKNSFGIISDEAITQFTVLPPWYRHSIAYLFYLILIGTSIRIIRDRIKIKIRKNKYYETIEQRRLYLEKETRIRQEQYKLEKEIEKLKNDKLQIKILAKDKELVTNSLQVVKKNKILNGIIQKLKDINTASFDDETKFQFDKLRKSILKEVNSDKSWKDLEKHIKNVHFDFLKRLKEKHPTISPRELDLATYLLMNMSTKEIAEIMNISGGGVELARYRLRKKLDLNKKENLIGYLMSI
ncbi:triple tyrosine motif-containing protein [Flavobacterium sp.]|jgi:DNA-binding CsgD family transcriptional regulator/ligand-binding sensor domain-containing protein|uniref:helix-turn-helix and ligand-binding sensor domain-containing protein n=1 Tax=Flavobacterium sp. TaxID=239 RepID=UPI0025FC0AC4|nr:triple tyrosine motif-containing protein [Flavobacterium sp.]